MNHIKSMYKITNILAKVLSKYKFERNKDLIKLQSFSQLEYDSSIFAIYKDFNNHNKSLFD